MHIGLTGWQREAAEGDYRELLALFQRADALGYDSLWLPEYHLRRTGLPYPSPFLLAAAVFATTERLRVGTGVALLPVQHPLLLAEQLAQLDVQSGGRLDVGIGRGSDGAALAALGVPPDEKHDRFVAAYETMLRAWDHGRVASDSGPWQFAEVEVGPVPVQRPHPPMYVAGASPETIAFAVQRGLPHLLSLEPPEGRQLERWRACVGPGGRLAGLGASSLNRYVFIEHTDADAERLLDRALPHILKRRRWSPVDVTDAEAVAVARADLIRQQAIVGGPDTCVRQITRLVHDVGTGHLRCVFNALGGLDRAETLAGMELFAREVLPACRAIVPPPDPIV